MRKLDLYVKLTEKGRWRNKQLKMKMFLEYIEKKRFGIGLN